MGKGRGNKGEAVVDQEPRFPSGALHAKLECLQTIDNSTRGPAGGVRKQEWILMLLGLALVWYGVGRERAGRSWEGRGGKARRRGQGRQELLQGKELNAPAEGALSALKFRIAAGLSSGR